MKRHLGHRLRILHWCTEQAVTTALAEMELTSAQSRILGYLSLRKSAPCAKDIEEESHRVRTADPAGKERLYRTAQR